MRATSAGRPQQPELRTPLAWRHRDMSFNHSGPGSGSIHNLRPSSPSVTSTSSDDREEVPMVRHPPRSRPVSRSGGSRLGDHPPNSHHHHHHHHPPPHGEHFHYGTMGPGYRSGTLRSTRSVPALALATWDGEPCPVHGHGPPVSPIPPIYAPSQVSTMRRYGSLYDVRSGNYAPSLPPPPPVIMTPQPPPLEKKSFHGSMQLLANGPPSPFGHPGHPTMVPGPHMAPHHFLPPMMRPRPLVFPAMAEPLPMRDPFKMRTPPPGMVAKPDADTYSVDEVCCKGHLIVLWIILGVVTVGVILGIVLGVKIT